MLGNAIKQSMVTINC